VDTVSFMKDGMKDGPNDANGPNAARGAGRTAGDNFLDLADQSGEHERISITDVNGTVARFEMAYSPTASDRFAFGPPMRMRIPSFLYLGFAVVLVAIVLVAYNGSSNSPLYIWVVEGDRGRPLSSGVLAFIVLASAVGTVIRTHMRGVIVRAEGVEARYVLLLGLPRIKRWAWSQVERIVLDDRAVMFELWNGTYERMPEVAEPRQLGELLERIAAARRIRVTRLPGFVP
jgi:hypothetical protein